MAKLGHKKAKKIRKSLKEQTGIDYRKTPDIYRAAKNAVKKGEQEI